MRNFWSSASSPHGGKETGCGECDTSGIQFQLLAAVAEMLGRLCNYSPLYKERRFGGFAVHSRFKCQACRCRGLQPKTLRKPRQNRSELLYPD